MKNLERNIMKTKIKRRFEIAKKAAMKSDFRVQVGCAVYYKNKLIAIGASTNKTSPLQKKYNVFRKFDRNSGNCLDKAHAEIIALSKIKKKNINMSEVVFYVVRVCKSEMLSMARPCPACTMALMDAGVRKIFYTTEHNGYSMEVFGQYKGG